MYIPEHFAQQDIDIMHDLMVQHPFATLFCHARRGLDAHHLPFELELGQSQFGVLQAHVARNNPVWRDLENGDEVLVVFQAGDAYISPNWYPSKHQHHQQVPTWNYRVVHVYGNVKIYDDERYVRGVVARLTRRHEASQEKPWKMSDAPPDYIASMLRAIVGIEIEITQIQAKFKLGQNKTTQDIFGAAAGLQQIGQQDMANAMHLAAQDKDKNHE